VQYVTNLHNCCFFLRTGNTDWCPQKKLNPRLIPDVLNQDRCSNKNKNNQNWCSKQEIKQTVVFRKCKTHWACVLNIKTLNRCLKYENTELVSKEYFLKRLVFKIYEHQVDVRVFMDRFVSRTAVQGEKCKVYVLQSDVLELKCKICVVCSNM
jgi:hypothetical protein